MKYNLRKNMQDHRSIVLYYFCWTMVMGISLISLACSVVEQTPPPIQPSETAPALAPEPTPASEPAPAPASEPAPAPTVTSTPTPAPIPNVADDMQKMMDDRLQQKVAEDQVRQQQTNFLVQNYLKSAQNYAQKKDYQAAYQFVMEALKLQPQNQDALRFKRLYGQRLGYRADEVAEQMTQSVQLVQVKIEQTKLEVDNQMAQGKRLMKEKKYAEAKNAFMRAKEILRWLPYHVADLEGKGRQLDLLIEKNEQEEALYKEELDKQQRMEAEERSRKEEQARLNTLQSQVRNLFRQANLAFEHEKYDLAESFCQQVTILDPENVQAKSLIELIRQARHAKVFEQSRTNYLDEWKKIFVQIDDAMIPIHEIVNFPSYETWKEIEKRGSKNVETEEQQESQQDREVRQLLETKELSMDFDDMPFREVIEYLRGAANINIYVDPEVYKTYQDEDALKIDLTVSNLKLSAILNWMLTPKDLGYRIFNGVLVISTKKKMSEKPQLRLYNVRDLTGKLNDFPAFDIDLSAKTGGGGTGGGTTGAQLESPENTDARPATTITEDQLTKLIKDNIAKNTWEGEGGNSIDIRHGTLIIRHTAEIHQQIESLLNDLRKTTGLLVTIEARFLTVSDDFLEDIGVDWRSLGATAFGSVEQSETSVADEEEEDSSGGLKPGDIGTGYDYRLMDDVVFGKVDDGKTIGTGRGSGLYYKYRNDLETRQRLENIFDQTLGDSDVLTNSGGLSMQMAYLDDIELQMVLRAVRKRSRSNVLTAPRLTVFNTQRANVTIVNQIAYVEDYEVEIATKSTIADPTVGTVQDGVILDVKPVISADRKYITLELQPTVAKLINDELKPVETQLASSAGSGPGTVKIQLPNLRMTKIKTTITIPDGGTILLGGLMEGNRQDYTSGVPFLSDLPIISFFTSRQGKYAHRQSLLILVSAKITSMEEQAPKEGLQN